MITVLTHDHLNLDWGFSGRLRNLSCHESRCVDKFVQVNSCQTRRSITLSHTTNLIYPGSKRVDKPVHESITLPWIRVQMQVQISRVICEVENTYYIYMFTFSFQTFYLPNTTWNTFQQLVDSKIKATRGGYECPFLYFILTLLINYSNKSWALSGFPQQCTELWFPSVEICTQPILGYVQGFFCLTYS